MQFEGTLRKMSTNYGSTVRYSLRIGEDLLFMNRLLGTTVRLEFSGECHCVCGKVDTSFFRMNFCRECFFTRPEASPSILKPELSKAHLGIEERDLEFEKRLQLQPHYVYLAKTDRIKVGVTRNTQMPYRWMDQGAKSAMILLEVPNRYLAGEAEVALKDHFTDKTSWQAMLKDLGTDDELGAAYERAAELVPASLKQYLYQDPEEWHMNYPIRHQIDKVKSVSFKAAGDVLEGELWGIRGQYLITSTGVFNVRSHAGYLVQLTID